MLQTNHKQGHVYLESQGIWGNLGGRPMLGQEDLPQQGGGGLQNFGCFLGLPSLYLIVSFPGHSPCRS